MRYNKINVFFDTNKLECRFNGSRFFLDDITLNKDFQEILDFSNDNDNVSFFIPQIVWREILTHLTDDFNNSKQSLIDTINNHKKGFGSLINITTTFSTENYEEYINEKAEDFLLNYKENVAIVSHSNHEEKFKSIIDNAINKRAPFTRANKGKKEYTDAGFKDMLILETIIDNCKHDEIGILYTDDRDFKEAFVDYENDKYYIAHTINDLKKLITDKSIQFIEKNIKKEFLKNEYLQEMIYNELNISRNDVIEFYVQSVSELEEHYNVEIFIVMNVDNNINIDVEYDSIANEILSIQKFEVNYE